MKKRKETIYNYEVIFDYNGEGYTITVPGLPGLVTEGDNLKEAREMAKDAIRCCIEALLKDRMFISQKSNVRRKERIKVAV
ncbi:MAG: HicB family protein [Candidatus Nealsonbacteria bacterium CG10_big_fil_rev_8_21_14_0_10_36_24]|uniref:HicB family protein n=2 Tax=Candidatus Nealsoniibacteriota TaxID=1817911 RepID=A0A2H0YPY0_9BACT|nr:MAG: HicB family protein [Candidatus Nealsonbacteria bacterium CG10_big_fil_rev_8_21_14_0_10_36_24]PIS39812.1 MAG: HicB family protein [Candidatus Nealsonbacteria bacterium CG08_land_8_20_14_0_20_36_22]